MRIAHWLIPGLEHSGVFITTNEMVQAENKIEGIEAKICYPEQEPWKADVNVFHTIPPSTIFKLKNKVHFCHTSPNYMVNEEVWKITRQDFNPMTFTIELMAECDLNIVFWKRYLPYFREMAPNIEYIPRGIDLDSFTPLGDKVELAGDPSVLFCENWRFMKHPFPAMLGCKIASKQLGDLRLHLLNGHSMLKWQQYLAYMHLCDLVVNFGDKFIPDLKPIYRGAGITISPAERGDISRIGLEAMACGCPTITVNGDNHCPTSCPDEPDDIADMILKIKENPDRTKYRKVMKENYDVNNSARIFIDLLKKYFSVE